MNSLKTKLCQGLRAVSAEGLAEPKQGATTGGDRRGDIDVSAELLLEGPQLTIRDPTNSITGLALQGLLTMARTVSGWVGGGSSVRVQCVTLSSAKINSEE